MNCLAKRFTGIAAVSLVVTLAIPAVSRAAIIDPVSATASSFYSAPGDNRSPDQAINGSGLSPTAGPWEQHDTDATNEWLSNNESQPTITFDLGSVYDLDGFHLWNINDAGGDPTVYRGIYQTQILVSTTGIGGSYTTLTDPVSNTTTFTFTPGPGLDTYTGDDYALPETDARYIQFDVLNNFYPSLAPELYDVNHHFTGIAEIRFETTPEPASLALLGLGGLLLLRRRGRGVNPR